MPADGFYEWQAISDEGTRRNEEDQQPWFIRRRDGEPLAFAGLWEIWHDPQQGDDAPRIRTCTIITTRANELVAPIHDRMPVVLPESAWDEWLDRENHDVDALHTAARAGAGRRARGVAGDDAREQAREQRPGADRAPRR